MTRKLNVNGGAIAIGHPLGATGVRLAVTLARELRRSGLQARHRLGLHRRRAGHRAAGGNDGRDRGNTLSMQLAGHAAIVTGGGSGLGAATAERLAQAGCRVAVLDRDRERAREVAARIGGDALVCDVADEAAATAAVAEAARLQGAARILVNCAGIGTAARIVGREGAMPLASFERVIRVNLIGTFNMLRLAAAGMSTLEALDDGERGVIINTASIAAYDGQIGQSAYAASKGGIVVADAAGGARAGAVRRARADHRARPVRDPDGQRAAGGGAGQPRAVDPVPHAPRPSGGVRRRWCSPASPTRSSTARPSGWTARCAWRRDERGR